MTKGGEDYAGGLGGRGKGRGKGHVVPVQEGGGGRGAAQIPRAPQPPQAHGRGSYGRGGGFGRGDGGGGGSSSPHHGGRGIHATHTPEHHGGRGHAASHHHDGRGGGGGGGGGGRAPRVIHHGGGGGGGGGGGRRRRRGGGSGRVQPDDDDRSLPDEIPTDHIKPLGAYILTTTLPKLPTHEQFLQKQRLADTLERQVRSVYPHAELFVFGSCVTGLAEKSSDLDISCDLYGDGHYEAIQDGEVEVIVRLGKMFAKTRMYSGLVSITRARVPIVQNDPRAKADHNKFDLSLRLYGAVNSYLLRSYLDDPAVRVAGVVIKVWSKSVGINNSPNGYLSSYAIAQMYIYYLIRTKRLAWVDPAKFMKKGTIPTRPPSFKPVKHSPEMEVEVGTLAAGFFEFYALDFDWEATVVSIACPDVVTKEELGWTKSDERPFESTMKSIQKYYLAVQDPYELRDSVGLNCAKGLRKDNYRAVRIAFKEAWCNLGEGTLNLRSFTLV